MTPDQRSLKSRGLCHTNDEETARRRAIMSRGATVVLLVTAGLVLLVTSTYTSLVVRSTQVTNGPTLRSANHAAHSADRATDRIEECTTPGKPCYRQSQRQIAGAVGDINTANAVAAAAASYCAALSPGQTFAQIYACTVKRASQAAHHK